MTIWRRIISSGSRLATSRSSPDPAGAQVPCHGLCYDKFAGGAAGVMLTSLLILLLWYLAMSKCATLVKENPDGTYGCVPASLATTSLGPRVTMFPVVMIFIAAGWICLRLCFGPGISPCGPAGERWVQGRTSSERLQSS